MQTKFSNSVVAEKIPLPPEMGGSQWKAARDLLDNFSKMGTRYTQVIPSGKFHFRVENTITRLDGRVQTTLVAKIDGYGNIVKHGIFADPPVPNKNYVLNADGERFAD